MQVVTDPVLTILSRLAGAIVLLALGAPSMAEELVAVRLSSGSFNPSLGETVGITYSLPASEKVWVHLYDSDGGLVRTLVDGTPTEAGEHRATWDG